MRRNKFSVIAPCFPASIWLFWQKMRQFCGPVRALFRAPPQSGSFGRRCDKACTVTICFSPARLNLALLAEDATILRASSRTFSRSASIWLFWQKMRLLIFPKLWQMVPRLNLALLAEDATMTSPDMVPVFAPPQSGSFGRRCDGRFQKILNRRELYKPVRSPHPGTPKRYGKNIGISAYLFDFQ